MEYLTLKSQQNDLFKFSKIINDLYLNKVIKMTHNCDLPKVGKICLQYKMLNLSPKELMVIAKIRGIKGYKSMSEDKLLRALNLKLKFF